MGFWHNLFAIPQSEWEYTPVHTDDPDWQERQQLQKEKQRLQKKLELMQLTEDIDGLRDACEKMTLRHQEFEQRHQNQPTEEK